MQFICERLMIEGLLLIVPPRFADTRGYFTETYNTRVLNDLGVNVTFVQDNEAFSERAGTLRGLHFQLAPFPQAKLVRVIAGSIFDVAVDLRTGSATFGRWCDTILSASGGEQIFIPAGFAHAYCTLEPKTLVSYKVDNFYNKSAEAGILWEDRDIGIIWPLERNAIIVSDEDSKLPSLREVQAPFQFHQGDAV